MMSSSSSSVWGVSDWGDKDHRANASTQVIHHSTAMIDWVIQMIKWNEMTVSYLHSGLYPDPN